MYEYLEDKVESIKKSLQRLWLLELQKTNKNKTIKWIETFQMIISDSSDRIVQQITHVNSQLFSPQF